MITGYQENDLEASNDSSYYYGYFDDLTHWELANGKVQNYFYDLHDQLVKAANKPTTSTATKSASHARLPIRTAIWFGDYYGWGKLKSETNVTGVQEYL